MPTYISTGLVPTSDLFGDGLAVSIWMRPEKVDDRYIMGAYDAPRLFWGVNNGQLEWGIGDTTSVVAGTELDAGKWYFVALLFDGTNARAFVDGLEVNSAPANWAGDNTHELLLGMASGSNYRFFGAISSVAIYDHTLTPEQIKHQYEVGVRGIDRTVVTESTLQTVGDSSRAHQRRWSTFAGVPG